MQIPLFKDATRALSLSPVFQNSLSGEPSSEIAGTPLSSKDIEAGGSPLSFCEVSRSADLFNITSVELTQQPVYMYVTSDSKPPSRLYLLMVNSDDVFLFHLYGTFQDSFTPNATIDVTVDCGSHCEEYGAPPGDRPPGETVTGDFCEMSEIEQPLGGRKRNQTCPPEEGYALISSPGYVVPMFFSTPVSVFSLSYSLLTHLGCNTQPILLTQIYGN